MLVSIKCEVIDASAHTTNRGNIIIAPAYDKVIEAVNAGFDHSPGWNKGYPRIQMLTVEELLPGSEVKMRPQFGTFKQAQRVQQAGAEQQELGYHAG